MYSYFVSVYLIWFNEYGEILKERRKKREFAFCRLNEMWICKRIRCRCADRCVSQPIAGIRSHRVCLCLGVYFFSQFIQMVFSCDFVTCARAVVWARNRHTKYDSVKSEWVFVSSSQSIGFVFELIQWWFGDSEPEMLNFIHSCELTGCMNCIRNTFLASATAAERKFQFCSFGEN